MAAEDTIGASFLLNNKIEVSISAYHSLLKEFIAELEQEMDDKHGTREKEILYFNVMRSRHDLDAIDTKMNILIVFSSICGQLKFMYEQHKRRRERRQRQSTPSPSHK